MKFCFVQPVFFKKLRPTAVGTDTVLTVVQAEYGASALLQLIVVRFVRQLFLCIHAVSYTHLDVYKRQEEGYVLTWKSEDPSIATVTPGGKVTGISEGYVNLSYDFCRLEDNAHIGGGFIQFYVSASDRKADYTDQMCIRDSSITERRF